MAGGYGICCSYPAVAWTTLVPYLLAGISPYVGYASLETAYLLATINFILSTRYPKRILKKMNLQGKVGKLVEMYREHADGILLINNMVLLPVADMIDMYWLTVEEDLGKTGADGRLYPSSWPVACVICWISQSSDGTFEIEVTDRYTLLPRDLLSETSKGWIYNSMLQGSFYAYLRSRFGAPYNTNDVRKQRFDNGAWANQICRDISLSHNEIVAMLRFQMMAQARATYVAQVERWMGKRTAVADHWHHRLSHFGARNVTSDFSFIPQPISVYVPLPGILPDSECPGPSGPPPSEPGPSAGYGSGSGPSSDGGRGKKRAGDAPDAPKKKTRAEIKEAATELMAVQQMVFSDEESVTASPPTLERQNAGVLPAAAAEPPAAAAEPPAAPVAVSPPLSPSDFLTFDDLLELLNDGL